MREDDSGKIFEFLFFQLHLGGHTGEVLVLLGCRTSVKYLSVKQIHNIHKYIILKNPWKPEQSQPLTCDCYSLNSPKFFLFSPSPTDSSSPFCLSSCHPSTLPFNNCNLLTILASFSSRKMDFDMTFSYCFYPWDASKMGSNTFCLSLLSRGILLHQRKTAVINFISNC